MGCCIGSSQFNYMNDIPNYTLYFHARVWNQHTHGLFDFDQDKEIFDSDTIINSYFEIKNNCFLVSRNEKVVEFTPKTIEEKLGHDLLLSIVYKNGRYWIYHSRDFTSTDALLNPSEQAWIVLKEMNKNVFKDKLNKKYGYRLTGGDTIKFGRVRFVVKKISSDAKYDPNPTLIMKEVEDEPESNDCPSPGHFNKTEDIIEKNNEREDFQDVEISKKQTIIQEGNINKLRKSIKVLQNITRNSYESSLFFDIINNPAEDFMSDNSENQEKVDKEDEIQIEKITKSKSNEKVCRICLGTEEENENEEDNPLFAPCICSGTMKYVHLECMQQWIQNKRHSKEAEKVKSYNWKFLECELCKHKIHEEFEYKGRKFYLLNYERPKDGHYLVLESFTNTPHKTIHVIQITEEMAKGKSQILIKVGRGTEVDVRITDISVSRYHSKIYFQKGEFYCVDNNSKFGTVALLRQPISLPQRGEHFFQIQVGKHLIELESEAHLNMCFCNITNRKIKNFKGTLYKDFKSLIPQNLRTKLDMLENVTNVMETLNMEEAENNLNREITKLKLINESQVSQRNATLENAMSQEEIDKEV